MSYEAFFIHGFWVTYSSLVSSQPKIIAPETHSKQVVFPFVPTQSFIGLAFSKNRVIHSMENLCPFILNDIEEKLLGINVQKGQFVNTT